MTDPIPRWLAVAALLLATPAEAQDGRTDQPAPVDESTRDSDADAEAANIYPHLAAGLIEMGVPVIDARTAEQVEQAGVLNDAVHVPPGDVDRMAELIGDDRDRAVVVYAASGRLAERVVAALRERGFSGLVNAGGREDLRRALQGAGEAAQ